MQTQALIEHLNAYLNAASFKDYASQALIDHACSMGADCILVHHGWFWKGERSEVVGMKQRRLKALLKNDINLIAYHLPLDAHEEVGNNAEIARVLGLEIEQRAGSLELLCVGRPKDGSVPVEAFVERVAAAFGGIRVRVGEAGAEVRRVGWCSGAAQDELVEAATSTSRARSPSARPTRQGRTASSTSPAAITRPKRSASAPSAGISRTCGPNSRFSGLMTKIRSDLPA